MAALNYNILLSDTSSDGTGPYQLTVLKNPTTNASGGTSLLSVTNVAPSTLSPNELGYQGVRAAGNDIAGALQNDALN